MTYRRGEIGQMKIFELLDRRERKLIALAIIRSILGIVLEIAALTIFVVLTSFLISINGGAALGGLRLTLFNLLSLDSNSDSASTAILLSEITVIFLLKNFVGYSNVLFVNRIIASVQNRVASDLYIKFFRLPYVSINSINTTEASASLVDSMNFAIAGRISFFILGLVEIANIITILAFLSSQSIQITISLILFVLSLLAYTYLKLRRRANKNGLDLYQSTISSRIYFSQGKDSISIFTLSGRIPFFLDNLNKERKRFTQAYLNSISLQQLPKYLIESYLLLSLGFLYLVSKLFIDTESSTLFLLLFVLAGMRILPSITRLQSLWLGMADSKHRIDTFQNIYNRVNQENSDLINLEAHRAPMPPDLRIERIVGKDLNFFYGEKCIIKNLNFKIRSGSPTLIRGASGSGKSTLINMIAGLIKPTSGSIKYYLSDGSIIDADSMPYSVGYVPQHPIIFKGSLAYNVMLESELDQGGRNHLLESMKFVDDIGVFPVNSWEVDSIEAGGSNLSGGERQRINIARAVALESQVLIMDEPTNSLDNSSSAAIMEKIHEYSRKKERIVVSTTHQSELHKMFKNIIDV
jgi:ABC-type bacteriocin/lantibiotic exporter with double-glycine peptidase domain